MGLTASCYNDTTIDVFQDYNNHTYKAVESPICNLHWFMYDVTTNEYLGLYVHGVGMCRLRRPVCKNLIVNNSTGGCGVLYKRDIKGCSSCETYLNNKKI